MLESNTCQPQPTEAIPEEVAGTESNQPANDVQAPAVVIHPWVDLDAAACVALTGVPLERVYFLPANAPAFLPSFTAHGSWTILLATKGKWRPMEWCIRRPLPPRGS